MTVQTTVARVSYPGDGVTTSFTIPFMFYENGDVDVIQTTAAGVQATLALGTNYTLSGAGNVLGGTLSLINPVPNDGSTIQAFLNPSPTQLTHYVENQPFPSEAVETNLDRLTQMIQRILDLSGRTITKSDGDTAGNLILPAALLRANQVLSFDSAGNLSTAPIMAQALTSAILAPFIHHEQTLAEIAANIAPTDLSFAPGDVQRYGADPEGINPSDAAWTAAIACNARVFDSYPGGGKYLFNNEVLIGHYPCCIEGQVKNINTGQGGGAGGTQIILATTASAGSAALRTNGYSDSINIRRIGFGFQSYTKVHIGLRFTGDLRGSNIEDCSFTGSGIAGIGTNVVGIQFDGATQFTGEVNVRGCYFTALQYGIAASASTGGFVTTVRILDCTLFGNSQATTSYGIDLNTTTAGLTISNCTIEGWTIGIYNQGSSLLQSKNYFQGNTIDFQWTVTSQSNCFSIGDSYTGSGSPNAIFSYNNGSANCVTSGSFGEYFDSRTIHSWRGFNELGLAANMGYGTTPTFSTGNFSAVGGGNSWTVASGGVTTYTYARKGGEMTLSFSVSGTVAGAPTVLTIAIPGPLVPAAVVTNTIIATTGGSNVVGFVQSITSASTLQLYCNINGSTAWTAGTCAVEGQITFRIIS